MNGWQPVVAAIILAPLCLLTWAATQATNATASASPTRERLRITLFELMALIAGLALGIWLIVPAFQRENAAGDPDTFVLASTFALGGLSVVGPPLLIWERRRSPRRRAFGAGRLMWFSQGIAA